MNDCDQLMAALFDNPQREHIDIKFFMGGSMDVAPEDVCREAVKMLAQMDAGEGADESFEEHFEQRDVADLLRA